VFFCDSSAQLSQYKSSALSEVEMHPMNDYTLTYASLSEVEMHPMNDYTLTYASFKRMKSHIN
jgi:hypothetical protein